MTSFTVHGPGRILLGVTLGGCSAVCLWVGAGLGYGIAATTWIPALLVLVPASALVQRRRLRVAAEVVVVESGWLWRHERHCRLAGASIVVVPTAGLRAVVLAMPSGGEVPLATWVWPSTADRLLAWLDAGAGMRVPRVQAEAPAQDR